LTYRTVFDVDVGEGQSVIDGWTRGAPSNAIVIVDPAELRRFSKTYYGIPPPPVSGDEPYVIDRQSGLR
jgi:hypothetical protein